MRIRILPVSILSILILLLPNVHPVIAKDYWIYYEETQVPPSGVEACQKPGKSTCQPSYSYIYKGFHAYETASQEPGLEERRGEFKKKVKAIREGGKSEGPQGFLLLGKPVVNKNDEVHIVVLTEFVSNLECTKHEEAFKQVDAPIVPLTPQLHDLGGKREPEPFICDLETRDKGNTKISYSIVRKIDDATGPAPAAEQKDNKAVGNPPGNAASVATNDKPKSPAPIIKGEVKVHELYRFRITSGPVFSSLSAKNRSYSTVGNVAGQQVIVSSKKNDLPASLPVFLKVYPVAHDILEPSPGFWERLGFLAGINLIDNPLKNFYLGMSFELWQGVDIVGGAHFAKVSQLGGGFVDGQIVASSANPPTVEKFLTGGFVGVTADLGVIGTWIGSTVGRSIKDGFK